MFKWTVRKFAGYDFFRYCFILHDYRFRRYLPENKTAQSGKTLQNMAVSGDSDYLFIDRDRFLHLIAHLQAAVYMARFSHGFTRTSRVLSH